MHRQVVRDAGAVRFGLVQSEESYYRKALLVSGLHELHAALDRYRTQRNRVDIQDEDHVDPPNQSRRAESTRTPEHMRPEQPHRPDPPDPSSSRLTDQRYQGR